VTGVAVSGSITTSGLTQSTARILGRTTASSGAVEEITVGANLSLSAGSLAVTGVAVSGSITTSGLTQSTARMLGRTSASSGAVEEITIGSGLTLAAGTLSASGSGPGGSTGDYQINSTGTFAAGVIAQGSTGRLTITPTASTSGTTSFFNLRTPADTGITVSTESVGIYLGGSTGSTVTRNWTGPGTVTVQREIVIQAPTYTSTGGVTVITTGATLAITGPPIETGTVGVTNALALWVQSGNSRVSLASGTSAVPGFQIGGRDTGFYSTGALLALSSGGVPAIGWNAATGATTIGDPYSIVWGSLGLTVPDISLSRAAVSVLRVGDASTGAGQLLVAANGTTATGQVTILSGLTTRNALFAQGAAGGTFAPLVGVVNPSVTTVATTHVMSLRARSTGTPAAGFGGTLNLSAQTSTTNDVQAAEIVWSWTTATHATRTSQLVVSVVAGATAVNVLTIDSAGLTISQRGIYLTQTGGGANYTGFIAPSTLTATSPYTMPTNYPAMNGAMLVSDTAGTLSWMLGASFKNALINGDFVIAQRGTSFTSSTPFLNNNDLYTLDRWYLLSNGNNIVNVAQSSDAPTNQLTSVSMTVTATGAGIKFGIAQIIEQQNCVGLVGTNVSLSFKCKISNARLSNVRAAVVAWSGTANSVTSDIISSWTTPTLIANATFLNVIPAFTATTNWETYTIENISVPAGTNNLIVFVWSDSTTGLAGDVLYCTDVQLESGAMATSFERTPVDMSMDRCQRYAQLIETENNTGMGFAIVQGTIFSAFLRWYFTTPMRVTPSFVTNITATVTGGGAASGTSIAFVNFNTNALVNLSAGATTISVQGSTRGAFIKFDVGPGTVTGTANGDIISLRFTSSVRCILSAEL
jgi:hypothetical protein